MDNPLVVVTRVERAIADVLKFPDLKAALLLLSKSPQFRRIREMVQAVGMPWLKSPTPGDCQPTTSTIDVVFGAGDPTASYTINIIASDGTVVHTCYTVPLSPPPASQGTCSIPAGTLGSGENYTIEVVTNGTRYTTIGWLCTL